MDVTPVSRRRLPSFHGGSAEPLGRIAGKIWGPEETMMTGSSDAGSLPIRLASMRTNSESRLSARIFPAGTSGGKRSGAEDALRTIESMKVTPLSEWDGKPAIDRKSVV